MASSIKRRFAVGAVACASALSLSVAPASADDLDTSVYGHPVAADAAVPFPAPAETEWRHFNVIRYGDRNFFNPAVEGLRVRGRVNDSTALCLFDHVKYALDSCYADGKRSTSLGYSPGGPVFTFDPIVGFFAPILMATHMARTIIAMSIEALKRGYF